MLVILYIPIRLPHKRNSTYHCSSKHEIHLVFIQKKTKDNEFCSDQQMLWSIRYSYNSLIFWFSYFSSESVGANASGNVDPHGPMNWNLQRKPKVFTLITTQNGYPSCLNFAVIESTSSKL